MKRIEKGEFVVVPTTLQQAIAAATGGFAPAQVDASFLSPISSAIIEEALKNPEPGVWVPGQGIYLGKYKPKDSYGISLGKMFNVFAAPEDLPDAMQYYETVKYIATLKDWHGFGGTSYVNTEEVYAALKDGSYNGGWIIPPHALLTGTESDNFINHKNKGVFKGTFKADAHNNADSATDWYWSSTESDGYFLALRFSNCDVAWYNGNVGTNINCRPVRLVEVSTP